MLALFFRLVIAVVVAVIVSGFYAGSRLPDAVYSLGNFQEVGVFIFATIITALLSGVTSKISSVTSSSSSFTSAFSSDADREEGTVKWFNVSKGFGFITRENGEDIFVHYRSIRGEGRRRLFDGQAVEFAVVDSDKGLQADDVEILS